MPRTNTVFLFFSAAALLLSSANAFMLPSSASMERVQPKTASRKMLSSILKMSDGGNQDDIQSKISSDGTFYDDEVSIGHQKNANTTKLIVRKQFCRSHAIFFTLPYLFVNQLKAWFGTHQDRNLRLYEGETYGGGLDWTRCRQTANKCHFVHQRLRCRFGGLGWKWHSILNTSENGQIAWKC